MQTDGTWHTEVIENMDLNGNITDSQTKSSVNGTLQAHRPVTRFLYDGLNRRKETRITLNESVTTGDVMGSTTFDWLNRPVRETDADGHVKFLDYDGLGNLKTVVLAEGDANSTTTTYLWNELGQQISQTDAENRTTRFEYDKLGRRTGRTLPGGQSENWAYDFDEATSAPSTAVKRPNKVQHEDFKHQKLVTISDVMGRLDQKKKNGAVWVDIDYTPTGQRSRMRDNLDATARETRYVYDNLDRLVIKAMPEGTLTYAYDSAQNLASISARKRYNFPSAPPYNLSNVTEVTGSAVSDGALMNYAYDARHRLVFVNKDESGSNADAAYRYDAVGNQKTQKYRNGVETTYSYNVRNQLTLMANGVASFKYDDATWEDHQLSKSGRRNRVEETISTTTRTVKYFYDALQRLTKEDMGGGNTVTYDAHAGYQNDPPGTGYDRVGNRRSRSITGSPGVGSQTEQTYDANDRQGGFTYDDNGNTTAAGTSTYGYDFENRLINKGTTLTFVYDGDGNRVQKTVGSTTTYSIIDDRNLTGYPKIIEERSATTGSPSKTYVIGLARVNQTEGTATSYYGHDGHGSVRYLTSAGGVVTDTYNYDAFGNLIGRSARNNSGTLVAFTDLNSETGPENTQPISNWYRFGGEQLDEDLGMYHQGARDYKADLGRWWTMDSFEGNSDDPISLHKYLFCAADPVNRVDPSGHESLVSIQFTAAIMGQFMAHELRGGHSILSAAERMFGADDGIHNVIYTLDVAAITTDTTSLVAGGAAAVTVGYKAIRYGATAIIKGGMKFARYLNRLAKSANNGKVVALGLEAHLDQFAGTVDYTYFTNGSKELEKWKAVFDQVMSNADNKIVFILDDVEVWPGLQRAASGRGGATDWELLMIKENPQWWDRIAWTRNGSPVENPFK